MTENIELARIRTDGGTQSRVELNLFTVDEYAKAMAEGVIFPPPVVFYDGEYFWLADGFHRIAGSKQAEKETVDVEVIEGTRRDAVLYSVGSNASHGLRRTNEDKRKAVRTLLYDDEWAQWSDREIARRCGVSNFTVSKMRQEMQESSLLDSNSEERSYTTKHGTISTMNTGRIGAAVIVPEARELLRESDVAEDKRELSLLRRMEPQEQVKVASLIATGEAQGVRDAQRCITYDKVHEMTLAESISGKFSVIYADPPWNYGNSGLDGYGHAERHYKTMLADDICHLPVGEYVTTNAVLFLWATSPLLDDALRVIDGWGFEYKTSFIWDKVKHNFGHYNSVRHEFLLLATRGSYTPESKELHDSVIELERTGRHSEKPQYFRELIEKLYPSGSKLELFARQEHEGWKTWGNEVGGALSEVAGDG